MKLYAEHLHLSICENGNLKYVAEVAFDWESVDFGKVSKDRIVNFPLIGHPDWKVSG